MSQDSESRLELLEDLLYFHSGSSGAAESEAPAPSTPSSSASYELFSSDPNQLILMEFFSINKSQGYRGGVC